MSGAVTFCGGLALAKANTKGYGGVV